MLAFQTVFPILVLVLFYWSIGRPMEGLKLSIVNYDNPNCDATVDFYDKIKNEITACWNGSTVLRGPLHQWFRVCFSSRETSLFEAWTSSFELLCTKYHSCSLLWFLFGYFLRPSVTSAYNVNCKQTFFGRIYVGKVNFWLYMVRYTRIIKL